MLLRLGARIDQVAADIPVPHHVAGTGERQRAALDIVDDALGANAGEGVLHHGEADRRHDQLEAAEQSGRDQVVGEKSGDGEAGGEYPGGEQEPGRYQEDRAVIAVGREIDDEAETDDGDGEQGKARDARGDRGSMSATATRAARKISQPAATWE